MSWERMLGTGLVVCFGCVFWLGVNILDGWVQRNVYPKIRAKWASLTRNFPGRKASKAAANLGESARIGKK